MFFDKAFPQSIGENTKFETDHFDSKSKKINLFMNFVIKFSFRVNSEFLE